MSQLECLEGRQLLTSLVAVHVSGNSINLSEVHGGSTSTPFDFSVSYTSSQVVLTGTNGTEFRQAGQTMATDTINITAAPSIRLQLNEHANDITISGDGTDKLSSLNLHFSAGTQDNSVTLNSVITDSLILRGRRSNDSVTLNQSTVNGNLSASLGTTAGDTLDLESTTVSGNMTDKVGSLTMNGSTVTGKLHNVEPSKDSTLTSTDTTYDGKVAVNMGQSGVINLDSSTEGTNDFKSAVTVVGSPRNETTVNEQQGSTDFAVTPTYRHATVNNTPSSPTNPTNPTLGTPTVNSQTIELDTAPVVTGTYDATNTTVLTVNFNGTTYTLGTSSQLTSPSSGQWSLNVNSQPFSANMTTVTATATDKAGDTKTGTGTITDGSGVIASYLSANNLTASTTIDGLRYVITTQGSGSVPTQGQTVTVNYSGFLLNTNGTLGTEFDSNTNSQFGHVTPFTFTLGAGTVIPGWEEAFALLPVGTSATLIIPPSLGYGASGSGSSIPPNSILVFNVQLVSAS